MSVGDDQESTAYWRKRCKDTELKYSQLQDEYTQLSARADTDRLRWAFRAEEANACADKWVDRHDRLLAVYTELNNKFQEFQRIVIK